MNNVRILGLIHRKFRCHNRSRGISWLFTFLPLFLLFGVPVVKAQFRAAVVKEDITPSNSQYLLGYNDRTSDGILDRIYHRILAIDDGTTQFFIISTDICLYSPSEYDKVASRLQKQYGINPLNVWWSVTHTHSAPEVGAFGLYGYLGNKITHTVDSVYTAMAEQKLIDGILKARENLVPAQLGVGWGFSQANINRRGIDANGKVTLGLNPDLPVDRRVGVIRIDKDDGSPLALVVNYPIHGTVMGFYNKLISGDAPGVVSEYVEEKIGYPTLFVNGAAGNLAPIYSVYPDARSGHLSQFKVLLGDRILEAYKKIETCVDSIKLVTGSLTLETPRKPGMDWPSELSEYTSTTKAGINMVKLPVRFLKINKDIAIWSASIELFCEVAAEVRSRSPFPFTFYFGYTNGWFGYMPTESAWEHGGYEPESSPFTPAAAKELKESVVGYLQREMQSEQLPVETKSKTKRRR
ncbi:MAG: neutral/alkaline non-lysosomal ceramidase N-terminal domain-containing protein [Ginsengibacter sp.]